jgi:predicted amidohydrolase YtcJ
VTDLLIHAGRVFTAAESEPLLDDAWVRVESDRIVEVTSTEPNAGVGTQKTRQPMQPSYRA